MANNTVLPGTGETVRDIDKGGVKTQAMIIDQGGAGTEDLVDATNPMRIVGKSAVVGASFTRPANTTPYTANNLIANNTAAGSVTPIPLPVARVNAGTGVLRRIRVSTSNTGLTGTEVVSVELFKTSPTVANGDGGAYSVNGVAAISLGTFDVVLNRVFTDGAKGYTSIDVVFDAASGSQNIYGLIRAVTGFTPASGTTWTLAVEVLQD